MNSIEEAVIITDTKQQITYMNSLAEKLTEWSIVESLGQPVDKIFNVCNTNAGEAITSQLNNIIVTKKNLLLSNQSSLITQSGSQIQITASITPLMTESNCFMGIMVVFRGIPRQYKANQLLHENNLHFAAIVSTIPDIAIIFDEQGQYLNIYGNKQHLLYREASSLLNKKVNDVLPTSLAKLVINTIQETLKSGEIHVLEYKRELPQGTYYFEARVTPFSSTLDVSHHVVWIAQDITEKKQALKSLQSSKEQFQKVFEQMPSVAVQGYNCNREVVYWNSTSESVYGYTVEEALGKKLEDLIIPAEIKDQVITATKNYLYQDILIPTCELSLRHKDGSSVPVFSSHIKLGDTPGQSEMYCFDIDLTDIKNANKEIEKLAYYDPLTNLPNRRLFLDRLNQEQKHSKRHSTNISILFLDIDNFKILNDSLGHSVGDLLLIEVGQRMQSMVRDEDTVARLGGDEFVVLLKGLSTDQTLVTKHVQKIAKNILNQLNMPIIIQSNEYIITASIGITLFSGTEDSADTLLKQADIAMYRAKAIQHNTYQFFHPKMQIVADTRLELEKDLHQAIQNQELELYFQPQFDNYGSIIGAEALLRWKHPTKNMVSPAEFIPVAEETGLIIAIGEWVIEAACKQLQQWEKLGLPKDFHLAINVSPKQFQMQSFVAHLLSQIKRYSISSKHLILELTEGVVIDNIQQTTAKMKALKSIGVKFSIDDFGTGYSSLVYLKQLPLDQLKIDQHFISDIQAASNEVVIVEIIISMAKLLNLQVIAEGVETKEQLIFLESQGCLNYQGYYFCKPVPETIFTAKLRIMAEKSALSKKLCNIPLEASSI